MRVLGHRLGACAPIQSGAGPIRIGGLVALLLVAVTAWADDVSPGDDLQSDAEFEETFLQELDAAADDETAASGSDTEAAPAADRPDVSPDAASDDDALDEFDADLQGQPAPEKSAGVEEIVVLGERRTRILEETLSVIEFDPEMIKTEGIRDIRDLSNFTPTLEIKSAFAASNPTIFIRGVGLDDFNANAASAVAIYQDGVYMQSPAGQLFQFFDVEGVEVLRGPQGSLYRSASAGAILVNSKKPTDDFESYIETTYGRFNEIDVTTAISGPILGEVLSGRLSGIWGIRDGITENRCAVSLAPPCNQTAGGMSVIQEGINRYTNNADAYAARGQLLFKPDLGQIETEWLLNVHGGQNFSRAFQFQHRAATQTRFDVSDPDDLKVLPGRTGGNITDADNYRDRDIDDFFAGDYDIDGPENLSLWGGNLKGIWRFGDGYQLESLTAYEWHDRYTLENTDANPRRRLRTEYEDTAWQVSQELSLHGTWGSSEYGDGTWVLGAYYLQEDLTVGNFFDALTGIDLVQNYDQEMRNFSAYTQSEYKISLGCQGLPCDFTVVSGIRYNVEYKRFDIDVRDSDIAQTSLSGVEDSQWDGLSGELSLSWNFSEESEVYVKYSRGWKGGHFNGGAVLAFDVITSVNPEIVSSYEAGLRSYWLDGRLMLNLTGFYYDYQDLQVFKLEQIPPQGFPVAKLVNAEDAIVYGVELDLGLAPIEGMNITLNAAWVESEYKEFVTTLPFQIPQESCRGCPPIPPLPFRQTFDYSGNPLIASPRLSMTGSVDYEIPIPGELWGIGLGTVTPRFSFSWKDDVFFDAGSGQGAYLNFPEGTFGQEAFWIFNAALAWRSENERIEVLGWAHNFLDEHYRTQSFDLSTGLGVVLDAYSDPRTYGITLTYTF